MPLIQCPECSKQISSMAAACPNCGHPINQVNNNMVQFDTAPKKRRKYRIRLLIFTPMFFFGFFLSMIWALSGNSQSGQFGFWVLVVIVGFGGMIVNAIGSWLSAP